MSGQPISDLRRRMLEDMAVRKFGERTRHDGIRHVEAFASFLGRSPDTATAEDVRRFQVHLTDCGAQPPKLNSSVSALRFFFGVTLDRPEFPPPCPRTETFLRFRTTRMPLHDPLRAATQTAGHRAAHCPTRWKARLRTPSTISES